MILNTQIHTLQISNENQKNIMLYQSDFRIVCGYATIECVSSRKSEQNQFGENTLLGL